MKRFIFAHAAVLALIAGSGGAAVAQSTEASVESADIIVTGTRAQNRSRLDTISPVDVISSERLTEVGTTELAQALSITLPSLTFPRPAITDGTDSIRPATLRGLAPDQTLVLVNSKRRHATALVNINNSIGRGSAAVDLNAIPTAAISSVEVLRDGASAQYGSDAIAGVVNLRLREAREGGSVSVTYGRYITEVDTTRLERRERDGDTVTVSGWAGLPLGAEGFLTVSAEYLSRDPTSRGDRDQRIDTPDQSPTGSLVTSRFGDPEVDQGTVYVNAGLPIGVSGWEAYGWFGYQNRESSSAANPRLRRQRALTATGPNSIASGAFSNNDAQTVEAVTPRGFLPLISPEIEDVTGGIGATGEWAGLLVDASLVYGSNRIDYTVENSLNASIARAQTTPGNPLFGQTPQRSFNSGALEYNQTVANLDFSRTFGGASDTPVTLAFGFEYRKEEYTVEAGERSSFDIARDPATGIAIPGIAGGGGAQGFPGLQPRDARENDRDAIGAYAEVEANLTPRLVVDVAARFEDYSDFGETLNGKLSGRYDLTDNLAFRGGVSSGFRAPSLQQTSFAATSTNFINGVATEVLTLPATDPIAAALGARPLDPETSVNYTAGLVYRNGPFELTVDAYYIEITDRIVLSDNLGSQSQPSDAGVRAIIQTINPAVNGARFFINGVDTETEGVDVVARYELPETRVGDFAFTVSSNFNTTDVTRTPTTERLAALAIPPVLFPQARVLEFEEGTPAQKHTFNVDWALGRYEANANVIAYDKVLVPNTTSLAGNYEIAKAAILNLEGRVSLGPVKVSLGAENVLDEYPTQAPIRRNGVNINTNSPTAFSSFSPFGFNGRYVYGRVAYSW